MTARKTARPLRALIVVSRFNEAVTRRLAGGAQQALGTITGAVTADDLLGRIFSEFCIGK